MERERQAAVAAVREAVRLCEGVREREAMTKQDRSPVTVADFGSQALVCRALAESFPADPIIGEEDAAELRDSELLPRVVDHVARAVPGADARAVCDWIDRGGARDYAPRFWTLDPIDGTKGFLRGEHYAVALALVIDGEPVVGALGCPGFGAVFSAVRGAGAIAEPLDASAAARPIRASATADAVAARFCESVESGHAAHGDHERVAELLGLRGAPVRMDSQAKYAAVARGDAEIYLRLPTRADYQEKIWDHAAGVAVLREAGGRVTDVTGAELDFRRGRTLAGNRGIVATNGPLHDRVVAAVRAVLQAT